MDCVATVSDGIVYDASANAERKALSSGWSQRDGAFGAFGLLSPNGVLWNVKTRRLSTAVLVLTDSSSGRSYLMPSQGRGVRSVFSTREPGVEQARVVRSDSANMDFAVYSRYSPEQEAAADWLIAAALAVAAVDGRRSIRR
nr:hypothetical protein [Corynebacterium lactis]